MDGVAEEQSEDSGEFGEEEVEECGQEVGEAQAEEAEELNARDGRRMSFVAWTLLSLHFVLAL